MARRSRRLRTIPGGVLAAGLAFALLACSAPPAAPAAPPKATPPASAAAPAATTAPAGGSAVSGAASAPAASAPVAAPAPATITAGIVARNAYFWPVWIAEAVGLFDQQAIKNEVV